MNFFRFKSFTSAARPSPQDRASWKTATFPAAASLLCLAAGCVSVPPATFDSATQREAMISHVEFLTQPALKGRKPDTTGSRLARKYIESRFKAYGLVPWGETTSFEQSFGFGKNVVGVLPGTDTNAAPEIVLLSAHYDALGKHKGEIHPGASDNASGVAVLLETARCMSEREPRPTRSVAFIAFDSEEMLLLGSFAFSCREDVRQSKIAAVVNLDMLGRDFMDVVTNTLVMTGTEKFFGLRDQVRRFGDTAGIRILPIGTDWVGPRSDHVVFESRGVPCLFFSSGMFRDYHKPTDTANKLNYAAIERSANVVFETVRELANGEYIKQVANIPSGDIEELRAITTLFSEVMMKAEEAGIKKDDAEAFQQLGNRAEEILVSGNYDSLTRKELIMSAASTLSGTLLPSLGAKEKSGEGADPVLSLGMQILQHFYLNDPDQITDQFRNLVAQVLKYQPGAFWGMPKFESEVYDIADDDITLTEKRPGTYELNALAIRLKLRAEIKRTKWLVNSPSIGLDARVTGMHCEGTREQLTDYCLLLLRNQQTNRAHSDKLKKLLRKVADTEAAGTYHEFLAARIERGGFKDETDWITHCILTGTPNLTKQAMRAARNNPDARLQNLASQVMADRDRRPDVRVEAMTTVMKQVNKEGLLAVCGVLDDIALFSRAEDDPLLSLNSTLAERMMVKSMRSFLEKEYEKSGYTTKTIGDLAQEQLEKTTKKDFGKDALLWRNWIENHVNSVETASKF